MYRRILWSLPVILWSLPVILRSLPVILWSLYRIRAVCQKKKNDAQNFSPKPSNSQSVAVRTLSP